MSSTDVAPEATSAITTERAIVGRKKLWSGGVISISIPGDAAKSSVDTDDGTIHFLAFGRGIKGSSVRLYVHTEDEDLIGTNIRASIKVMRRDFSDGHFSLYVDLSPVSKETRITHRLSVMANPLERVKAEEGWIGFDIAGTRPDGTAIEGAIVLSPPKAKITLRTDHELVAAKLAAGMMNHSRWRQRKPNGERVSV